MPNIPDYTAQGSAAPNDKGIQADEVAGRRIGMYGHQLEADANQLGAKLTQHQADMELSHGYAQSTTLEANLTEGWNQFVADPANKPLIASGTAAAAYMDRVVKPSLEGLGEGFQTEQGKRFATVETSRIAQNLFMRTAGEQSALTGQVWQANAQQTQNNMAASVLQDSTEGNINSQLALNADFAERTIPAGVQGAERAKLQEEFETVGAQRIAMAGYMGQMETVKNQYAAGGSAPAEAQVRERIASQKWFQYLTPEQQTELSPKLDEAVQRGKQLFTSAQNAQDKAQEDQGRGAIMALNTAIHDTIRAGGKPTPDQLRQVDAIAKQYGPVRGLTGDINSLQSLADQSITDANAYKFQQSDAKTADGFFNRALLPGTDPHALTQTEVDKAFSVDHRLSVDDHERLTKEINERDKPDSQSNVALKALDQYAQTSIRSQLTKSAPLGRDDKPSSIMPLDLQGDAAWAEARREIHIRFEARVAHGEDPNAVAKDLMSPNSPHSVLASVPFWKQAAQSPDASAFFRSPYGQLGMGQVVNQVDQVTPAPLSPQAPPAPASGPSTGTTIPVGAQVQAAHAAALAAPRQAGESAAAYLKRTGG